MFKPERFLSETPERDPQDFVFGFGRRYVNALSTPRRCISALKPHRDAVNVLANNLQMPPSGWRSHASSPRLT